MNKGEVSHIMSCAHECRGVSSMFLLKRTEYCRNRTYYANHPVYDCDCICQPYSNGRQSGTCYPENMPRMNLYTYKGKYSL